MAAQVGWGGGDGGAVRAAGCRYSSCVAPLHRLLLLLLLRMWQHT